MSPIDHTETVATAKADLERAGVPLTGPGGAFWIVQLAAWRLRASGAGLLTKNSGNNFEGFAVDIIAYGDGSIFDVLGDAGGENKPQSLEQEPVDPTRYHAPFLGAVVGAVVNGNPLPPQTPPPSPQPAPDADILTLIASNARLIAVLADTVTAINALNTRLDTLKMSGLRVHL